MSRKREHITLIFYIIFFIYDRLFIPSSAPAATVTLSYKNQWSTLIFPFTRDKQLIILSIIKIRLLLRNRQVRKKKWVGLCRKMPPGAYLLAHWQLYPNAQFCLALLNFLPLP